MSGTLSNTFHSYGAPALGAFNDLLLHDCGLSRSGKLVVAAGDDPRIVRVVKPSGLHWLLIVARATIQYRPARTLGRISDRLHQLIQAGCPAILR